MPFLVNIISPFPITDAHQLHVVAIHLPMAATRRKTGSGFRGVNNRLRTKGYSQDVSWRNNNTVS